MAHKKHDYEYVKNVIHTGGDTLISKEYINNKTHLDIQCSKCNNVYKITFTKYSIGTRCRTCSMKNAGIKQRTNETEVRNTLEENGDKLLELYFVKGGPRIKFECTNCNKHFNSTYYNYKKRIGCPCKNIQFSYEYVKHYVQKHGHKLISIIYINPKKLLNIKCLKCNQIFQKCFKSYIKRPCCKHCTTKRKKTIDDMQELIKLSNNGDILISTEYKGCNDKMDIKCGKCNEIFQMNYTNYRQGHKCPKCAQKDIANKLKLNQTDVELYLQQFGDTLVDDYVNCNMKINIQCGQCNNIYQTRFQDYKNKHTRCPCNSRSIGETLIGQYLKKKI